MLIGGKHWGPHKGWCFFAVVALVGMSVAYFLVARGAGEWPGGASAIGFWYGVAGGLIILFECFLYVRKNYLRAWRIGRTQGWLRAHIWLGLLTIPLLVYHSGFRLGGALSMWLMILLFVVVASGVWGLVLQSVLPQKMLDEVPAETIYGQIDHIAGLMSKDAERLVLATCGPAEGESPIEAITEEAERASGVVPLTIGAVRSAGRVQGKVLMTRAAVTPVAGAEPLRVFFHETLNPYLKDGKKARSPLAQGSRAEAMFQTLRTRLPPEAHATLGILENLCEQRRQLDVQARLHFWLHNWLLIHLPLSAALLVLMIVHVFVALKYL